MIIPSYLRRPTTVPCDITRLMGEGGGEGEHMVHISTTIKAFVLIAFDTYWHVMGLEKTRSRSFIRPLLLPRSTWPHLHPPPCRSVSISGLISSTFFQTVEYTLTMINTSFLMIPTTGSSCVSAFLRGGGEEEHMGHISFPIQAIILVVFDTC